MNKQILTDTKSTILFLKRKAAGYICSMTIDNLINSLCCNIVLTIVMQKVIDAIGYKKMEFLKEAVWISVLSLGLALLEPAFDRMKKHCVRNVIEEVQKKIFEMLIKVKADSFEKMEQGDILLRVTRDIEKIEQLYLSNIPTLLFALFHGILTTAMMFFYNPFLGALSLILGILQAVVNMKIGEKILLFSRKKQQSHKNMLQRVIELLDGYADIKMSHHADYFRLGFEEKNGEYVKQDYEVQKQKSLLADMENVFGNLSYIGIMIVGIWMVFHGKTTLGTVAAVIGLQGNAAFLFMNFSRFLSEFTEVLPSVRRVMELIEAEKDLSYEVEKAGKKAGFSENVIELTNLGFGYEADRKVLKNVNIKIKRGELVLIKGESGCGKSTLNKILLGFYMPQEGSYLLNGVEVKELGRTEITENIAYLDQESTLFPITILENIRLGRPDADMHTVEKAARLAGAHGFIQQLPDGYNTVLKEDSENISGGQKQRIALARMFVSNRPILLIDEGTASLDGETENIVTESLLGMKGKKTMIVVTHKTKMDSYADSVYVI